jgi:predicted permease
MPNLPGALRYTLRQFRLSPVFTLAAVLTLALGIGGTTAIFTLIHAVMLRSLPVADPAQLYRIGDGDDCCVEGGPQDRWGMYSYPLYERLKAAAPEFEEMAAFQAGEGTMSVRREGEKAARPLNSEYVTANYFSTLGIRAFAGRVFTAEEAKPSAKPVVVISHRAWESAYGANPSILGTALIIEGQPFTVIGIAPPGFFGDTLRSDPPDIWIPVQQEPLIAGQSALLRQSLGAWLRVIGRLRPGASIAGMGPRLTGVLKQWMLHDSDYPAIWMPEVIRMLPKQVIDIVPAGAGVAEMKEEYGRSLDYLLGVCGLVLLIACANVANLLLARAASRRGQTAVRIAVGASRRQIIVDALLESVLLAIGGSIAGLVIAAGAARLLIALAFRSAHFVPVSIRPSLLVLGVAFLLALVTGIIFGAAPAWFATRTDPIDALRGSGRGSTTDRSSFARKALLIVQAALSVVLIAGATMLARSLNKIEHQDFGYQVANRVVVSLNRPPATYTLPQLAALYRQIEARVSALPGVQGEGLALYNPLTDNWGELIMVAGHAKGQLNENSNASWDRVSADYLQSLGVTLLRGRSFTAADNEHTAPVAIVNQTFVKRFFKNGEEPLNHYFGLDIPELANTFRIVGIVRDAKFAGFSLGRPARPMFYVPLAQRVDYENAIMKRIDVQSHFVEGMMLVTKTPPGALEPVLTRVLAEIDPNLTINSVRTMRQQIELTFDRDRAVAALAGLFGLVALILAAVGLYGVTAYTVAQRTGEIGIRMALGADYRKVVRLVLSGAFRRVLMGLALGVPLAVGAGRLISSQLYGVAFWDPLALTVAACSLTVCAFFAALIPAARAASISPMSALRIE